MILEDRTTPQLHAMLQSIEGRKGVMQAELVTLRGRLRAELIVDLAGALGWMPGNSGAMYAPSAAPTFAEKRIEQLGARIKHHDALAAEIRQLIAGARARVAKEQTT